MTIRFVWSLLRLTVKAAGTGNFLFTALAFHARLLPSIRRQNTCLGPIISPATAQFAHRPQRHRDTTRRHQHLALVYSSPSKIPALLHSHTTATMKYVHAIILTLVLIIVFCTWLGVRLYKCMWRAIDAEVHELNHQRDVEAQVAAAGDGSGDSNGKGSGKGSNKGSKK